jgi:hypothetical protein
MPLVRLQNGTVVDTNQLAWQGGGTMFDATRIQSPFTPPPMPAPTQGLTTRKVNTVPVDMYGNPVAQAPRSNFGQGVGNSWSSVASAAPVQSVRTGMLPYPPDSPAPRPNTGLGGGPWQAIASASPVQGYPGASPSQQTALAGMFGRGQGGYWSGALKDQAQLPPNDGGEAGFLQAFGPQADPSAAVTAIDQAAPMPPLPRIRPIPPAQIPLTSITAPSGGVPQVPGAITFKKGDTVSALAKRLGMTTSSFADRYGITNPNKIRAGETVFTRPPVMPRMPPASMNRAPPQIPMPRPRPTQRTPSSQGETFDSVWAEARG